MSIGTFNCFHYFVPPKLTTLKLPYLIGQYLQANRSVNIEGFGRFFIDELSPLPDENDRHSKNSPLPIQYTYTPNIPTDDEFITYIIQQTGKIRPLAIADLETYTSLAKQLLNISKPFVIESVGTLINNNKGVYDFVPGLYEPPKVNTDSEKERKLRNAGDQVNSERLTSENFQYGREEKKGFSLKPKQALFLLLGIIAAALMVWAIMRYLNKKDKPATAATTEENKAPANPDTLNQKKTPAPVVFTDSNQVISYKVIHEVAGKIRADARYNKLKSYNDRTEIEPIDSVNYKLFVRVTSAVRDTARKKDSIRGNYKNGIYKGPVYIEFQ